MVLANRVYEVVTGNGGLLSKGSLLFVYFAFFLSFPGTPPRIGRISARLVGGPPGVLVLRSHRSINRSGAVRLMGCKLSGEK